MIACIAVRITARSAHAALRSIVACCTEPVHTHAHRRRQPTHHYFCLGVGWRDAPDGLLPEADMAEADWAQLRAFRGLVAQQARRLIKLVLLAGSN